MNFLAHLLLVPDDEDLLLGNFMGDFVRNQHLNLYPERVRQGIWLHRRIDFFTDYHPLVRESVIMLRPTHGKYAGVVWDVLSDALLSHHWAQFCDTPLREFTAQMYQVLQRRLNDLPPALQRRLPHMIADDWLMQYQYDSGIAFTLSQLQSIVSRPEFLEHGVRSLREHYEALSQRFMAFFPDAMAYVAMLRAGSE